MKAYVVTYLDISDRETWGVDSVYFSEKEAEKAVEDRNGSSDGWSYSYTETEVGGELKSSEEEKKPVSGDDIRIQPLTDVINHPSHYTFSQIECIDAIKASLSSDGFTSYLQGNIIKYLWRWRYKNGNEDIDKAKWYMDKLEETVKKDGE